MRFLFAIILATLLHLSALWAMTGQSAALSVRPKVSALKVIRARIVSVGSKVPRELAQTKSRPKPLLPAAPHLAMNPIPSAKSPTPSESLPSEKTSSIDSEGSTAAVPSEASAEGIPTVTGSSALYKSNPSPTYPRLSRRMGEEGKVLLKVLVNENGKVVEAGVMESSGYERLDASAMEAVRRWEFVAQERNGKVVASWVIVPVNFTLNS